MLFKIYSLVCLFEEHTVWKGKYLSADFSLYVCQHTFFLIYLTRLAERMLMRTRESVSVVKKAYVSTSRLKDEALELLWH